MIYSTASQFIFQYFSKNFLKYPSPSAPTFSWPAPFKFQFVALLFRCAVGRRLASAAKYSASMHGRGKPLPYIWCVASTLVCAINWNLLLEMRKRMPKGILFAYFFFFFFFNANNRAAAPARTATATMIQIIAEPGAPSREMPLRTRMKRLSTYRVVSRGMGR